MRKLEDKVAVVLGASAEKGTGWAIAVALAAAGAKVVVGARRLAPLEVLAERIGGKAVACNACNEEDVARLAQVALDAYGRVDIAVNSAGTAIPHLIRDVTTEVLQKNVELNYFGMVYFVKHMAKAMGQRVLGSEGSIILISSLGSTNVLLPTFSYSSAKAATDCMVRHAALEYAPQYIKVNSILPGPIISDMAGEYFASPGVSEAYLKEIPAGRLGLPEDFADAVMWLAGGAYVTGLNLQVNGGLHLTRMPYLHEIPGGEAVYATTKT